MTETCTAIPFQKDIPVIAHHDVIVAGGGPAGWVAAVAAARQGFSTALIERYAFLGGMASAGLVTPISRFHHEGRRVVGGIPWEFVTRLTQLGAAQVELPKGHISFDPEYYKLVAQRMVSQAGVHLYTNALVTGCRQEAGRLTHVIMETKAGAQALHGQVFIDATGEAALFRFANAPMQEGGQALQPLSMCFVLSGVDVHSDLLRPFLHHDGKHGPSLHQAIHDRLVALKSQEEVPQFGGPWFNTTLRGDQVVVNITRSPADALDPHQLTQAEAQMREDAFHLTELLRREYPAFRHCFICATATQGGIRETRHIRGAHVLTGQELLAATAFPDTVALTAHPMDIHAPKDDSQQVIPLPAPGQIPFRSLYAPEVPNLLCPGRAASADPMAFASLRVQAPCMAMGEAAGTAAGLMCATHTLLPQLDVAALRQKLFQGGCILA